MDHHQALERTDPARIGTVAEGSREEKEAVARFSDFVSDLSEERIRASAPSVYAEDAWLNDTLKTVEGSAAIEEYFVESARATEEIRAQVTGWARSGADFYFRWEMAIRFRKLRRGRTCRSIGMSHVRFDRYGRVAFHQDYWDAAAGLFEHIPILGWMIRKIKARL
jgi:hypothetical protein